MSAGGIEVDAKALRKSLRKADRTLLKEMRQANKDAAEVVARQAKIEVPRRSGRLAKSIGTLATQSRGQVRVGSASVPYAGPVHFGWPSRPNKAKGWRGGPIRPNPFIYTALDKRRGAVLEVYRGRVEQTISKAGLT